MNIIICLDDKNGIQFNKRRQSRDSVLCDRILEITQGSILWMNAYSSKMFSSDSIKVNEDYLSAASSGDFCFVEDNSFLGYSDQFEKVIIYRWNRLYPSDVQVNMSFLKSMKRIGTTDFKGKSHEKITEEIYE